jgi:hypothetical protein
MYHYHTTLDDDTQDEYITTTALDEALEGYNGFRERYGATPLSIGTVVEELSTVLGRRFGLEYRPADEGDAHVDNEAHAALTVCTLPFCLRYCPDAGCGTAVDAAWSDHTCHTCGKGLVSSADVDWWRDVPDEHVVMEATPAAPEPAGVDPFNGWKASFTGADLIQAVLDIAKENPDEVYRLPIVGGATRCCYADPVTGDCSCLIARAFGRLGTPLEVIRVFDTLRETGAGYVLDECVSAYGLPFAQLGITITEPQRRWLNRAQGRQDDCAPFGEAVAEANRAFPEAFDAPDE